MLQMTFVNCIAILSNYFGGEVTFVLVAKVNKSLTRIFSEKISECFRINTNASKTWLKYRPGRFLAGKSGFSVLLFLFFCESSCFFYLSFNFDFYVSPEQRNSSRKGSTLQRKNLLQEEQILFQELTPV